MRRGGDTTRVRVLRLRQLTTDVEPAAPGRAQIETGDVLRACRLGVLDPERTEAQRIERRTREVAGRVRRGAGAPDRAARAAAIGFEGGDDVDRVAVHVRRRQRLFEEQRAVIVVDLIVDEADQLLAAHDALGIVDGARLQNNAIRAGDDT